MKAETKARCIAIADEIREEAFIAARSKNPRGNFSRIDKLAREACDYFTFGLEVAPEPERVESEPDEYGYTCGVPGCAHDDSESAEEGFATMGEAVDAARAHRLTHNDPSLGIVTTERTVTS